MDGKGRIKGDDSPAVITIVGHSRPLENKCPGSSATRETVRLRRVKPAHLKTTNREEANDSEQGKPFGIKRVVSY
jgi:hypothetical protein